MICKNCGFPLKSDDQFCPNCGNKVASATDIIEITDEVENNNEVTSSIPEEAHVEEEKDAVVKENNVPVIIRVDYSNGQIAKTIADETGAKVLTMYSGHNITEEEFNSGKTMIDIMKGNIAVIKEALQ